MNEGYLSYFCQIWLYLGPYDIEFALMSILMIRSCGKNFSIGLGAIHKGRPQKLALFGPPLPPSSGGVRTH